MLHWYSADKKLWGPSSGSCQRPTWESERQTRPRRPSACAGRGRRQHDSVIKLELDWYFFDSPSHPPLSGLPFPWPRMPWAPHLPLHGQLQWRQHRLHPPVLWYGSPVQQGRPCDFGIDEKSVHEKKSTCSPFTLISSFFLSTKNTIPS